MPASDQVTVGADTDSGEGGQKVVLTCGPFRGQAKLIVQF
jgi:hypothetical protein